MKIHKQGHKIILFALILFSAVVVLLFLIINSIIISLSATLVLLVLLFLITWFFRIPARHPVYDENLVFSPADGKIVVIEETEETEYLKDRRMQVSIFMSPLNVHANYYPVSGSIKYIKYHKGKYLVAWHPKSSVENERSTVAIENDKKVTIVVKQIAGAVARRIITNAKEGMHAGQCEELGFIRFGSRVDIFLPPEVKILVSINQKVRGKKTVIARFE
jgi:phosphatidylserine decarboxylase